MTDYQKELIKEHEELCKSIVTLAPLVFEDKCDCSAELVNRAMQLKAMKDYEFALNSRLANAGICVEMLGFYHPTYFEHIKTSDMSSSTSPVEESVSDNINKPIKETTGENDVAK